MSADDSTPAEEQFTRLLIACDEALAAGKPAAGVSDTKAPSDLRPRLERGVACLQLLEQFWSTRPKGEGPRISWPTAAPLTHLGRFEIRRELGHGSFGTVFLAHDPLLGRDVALKIPRVPALATSEMRQRFHHEALAAARLDHPNLVTVYEAGVVDDICFIASPYCPGTNLAAWLQQRGQPVPWRIAATLLELLADAVQHAHSRGVLHRDLKPANILLQRLKTQDQESEDGSQQAVEHARAFADPTSDFCPKITDFGLAKLLEDEQSDQTRTGMIVGSPCYMAPEQAEAKNKEITTAADIYALGAILYEMITARPPFLADTPLETLEQVRSQEPVPPRHLQPNVPRDLETICLKCLHKDPHRRYVSAHELGEDLRRMRAGEPIQARSVAMSERLVKWAKRRPTPAAVIGVTCLAAILFIFLSVIFNFRLTQEKKATDQALQREVQTNAELTQALQRERQALYFLRISLAHHEWLANNVLRTEELLDTCPPELRQWEWRYLKGLGQSGQTRFLVHGGEIMSVAFEPKGKRVASGGSDGIINFWDPEKAQVIYTLRGHKGSVEGLAFSPDGQRLASASHDRTVKVWDTATGKECYTLPGHDREVSAVAFSPDGRRLVSASWDRTLKIWDTSSRQLLRTLPGSAQRFFCVTFSPDGRRIAAGSEDVRIWDSTTGEHLMTCIADPAEPLIWVGGVAFHPDGRRLASANGNKTIYIWDTTTGKPVHIVRGHRSGINSVQFSPDGGRLASAGNDQTARLWDTATGAPLQTFRGHKNPSVSTVAFAPDGQRLASGGGDKTVRLWDVHTEQEALILPGERQQQVVWNRDGRLIATVGPYRDRAVAIWDARTGKPIIRLHEHSGMAYTVAFSPDGRHLACGGEAKTIKVWDTTTWKAVATLQGHSESIIRVVYSPDGKYLASASWDTTIKMWDAVTGKFLRTLQGHTGALDSMAFAPDSKSLASASEDRTIILWNAASGEATRILRGPKAGVTSVAFDPTGKRLVTGNKDATVTVWNLETGEIDLTLRGHSDIVWDAVFSRDGQRIASASRDGLVKLWDAASGNEALTLRGQLGGFHSVAFSPDGTRLLAGTDGMIIWEALPAAGQ
jgi:WD40 repeat protein/serine/threonine protein kinase